VSLTVNCSKFKLYFSNFFFSRGRFPEENLTEWPLAWVHHRRRSSPHKWRTWEV